MAGRVRPGGWRIYILRPDGSRVPHWTSETRADARARRRSLREAFPTLRWRIAGV